MMGSGGLVVLDDTACMVDIARFFLQFSQNESCGKCTFCRIGRSGCRKSSTASDGRAAAGDLDELEELAEWSSRRASAAWERPRRTPC